MPHNKGGLQAITRMIAAFGLVGIAATLTHYVVAYIAFEALNQPISYANIFGYCVAFLVSFFGHSRFTFPGERDGRKAFIRFALVSLIGFIINQSLLIGLTMIFETEAFWMVLMASVVSIGSVFVLMKLWAFR